MTSQRFDEIRSQCEAGETPHTHIIEECLAEISRLAGLVYVLGIWHCPKCKFQLVTSVLYAKTGAVGVKHHTDDVCPNDGEKLLPQTWESDARYLADRIPQLMEENLQLEKLNTDKFNTIQAYCKAASEDKAETKLLRARIAELEDGMR